MQQSKKTVSIKDVATYVGLSVGTVSMALNNSEKIADKTYGYLNTKDRYAIKEISKYLEEVSKSHKISFDGCSIEINY